MTREPGGAVGPEAAPEPSPPPSVPRGSLPLRLFRWKGTGTFSCLLGGRQVHN